MARFSQILLLALAAATSSSAAGPAADASSVNARLSAPAARVVGLSGEKRAARMGAAANPSTKTGHKKRNQQRRRQHGGKRSADPFFAAPLEEPLQPMKRDLNTPADPSKLHKVALKRAHDVSQSKGLHPQIFLQQHINRGIRRLHGMTKRDVGPALDDHLESAMRKRYVSIYGHDNDLVLKKRSPQRGGHAMDPSTKTGLADTGDINNLRKGGGGQGQQQAAPDGGEAAAAAQAAGAGADTDNADGFTQEELDALEQNTITAPPDATAANSLGLSIESNDVGYFCTMQVGTPPRDFNVLLDSGSADFWVAGENCDTCGKHQLLGAASSDTFVDTGAPFEVTYGTGNVQGTIIQDSINIAGLQLNNHTFGANTQESPEFGDDTVPFDSLMGLAISTLSNQKTPTPIESLASSGLVAAAQMGFALGRFQDGNNVGEATFGGVDQTKFDGDLTLFANVNKQGFWEGAMADVTVDGKSTGLTDRTAILDTGTTLVIAPLDDANALHAAIPGSKTDGQGGFSVPCTTSAQVALQFGGQSFVLDPKDLAFQPLTDDLKGDCLSSISAGQIGGATEWLVGDAFLKSVYFATDVENNQIGLAPIKGVAAAADAGAAAGDAASSAAGAAAGSADAASSAAGAAADTANSAAGAA